MNPFGRRLLLPLIWLMAISAFAQSRSASLLTVEENAAAPIIQKELLDDAELISVDVPPVVMTNATFTAEITFRNKGKTHWTRESGHQHWLGSQGSVDNKFWTGDSRIEMPVQTVAPGEVVTFRFTCKAPATPGFYPFGWRLVQEFVHWTGDSVRTTITVVEDPERVPRRAPRYHIETWQREEGLPHNAVQAIAQTLDGYLWIGTQRGLARFDGIRFSNFDDKNTSEIRNPSIYSLCPARDGSLWIGTFGDGLLRLHGGIFTGYTTNDGLAGNSIRSLLEAPDGTLWIGTTSGMSRLRNGKFTTFTSRDGLANNTVRSLGLARDGTLWIGTGAAVNTLKSGDVIEPFAGMDHLPGTDARAIHWDREGTLFLAMTGGLGLRTPEDHVLYFTKEDGLVDEKTTALCSDRRGNLWVGSSGGLCRFTAGRWMTETVTDGSAFDAVSALLEDREGNLWVGTKDGLHRLTAQAFESFSQAQGLSHINTISVIEDHEGSIWTATWGGGLNKIQNGKVKVYDKLQGLPLSTCLSLHEDQQNNLWAGLDFDGGLIHVRDDRLVVYRKEHGLTQQTVRVICQDRAGRYWLGTSAGLVLFHKKRFTAFTSQDGLAGNTIRSLLEDKEGNLWIGSNDGLSRRTDGKFSSFTAADGLSPGAILALYQDPRCDLWIGSAGGGLNRYRNGEFKRYTIRDGLFSDDVHEILEDDDSFLWMSSRNGVFRVSKQDFDAYDAGRIKALHCQAYGKRDGIVSIECNSVAKPAGWKARDGRLWFATAKGLTVVDPKTDVQPNGTAPPVVIEQVLADKNPMSVVSPGAGSTLEVPPGRGELEFHYAALSYTAPEKNLFKYKLEGLDADWLAAGDQRVALYRNVPPGHYVFRVIASNNDGLWSGDGATLHLTLQPHHWQTWWFKSLVALVGVSVVASGARYSTKKRMEAKLERLAQQNAIEKERARIAQDMHDDLGARLTEIMFLSGVAARSQPDEVKEHVATISTAARELVQNLDTIVWAVDPKSDDLESLTTYIHDYADRFLANASLRRRFRIQTGLPARSVSSQVRHDVFLIIKEALNNVVKHASCSNVELEIRFEEEILKISIADNGIGFSPGTGDSFSNGLHNMSARAQGIGGKIQIEGTPGSGTRVRLRVPLN